MPDDRPVDLSLFHGKPPPLYIWTYRFEQLALIDRHQIIDLLNYQAQFHKFQRKLAALRIKKHLKLEHVYLETSKWNISMAVWLLHI